MAAGGRGGADRGDDEEVVELVGELDEEEVPRRSCTREVWESAMAHSRLCSSLEGEQGAEVGPCGEERRGERCDAQEDSSAGSQALVRRAACSSSSTCAVVEVGDVRGDEPRWRDEAVSSLRR